LTRRRSAVLLVLLGLILIGGGIGALLTRPQSPPAASLPTPITIIPPTAGSVHADPGYRIRLPQLGIDLPIVEGDGINAPLYAAVRHPLLAWPGHGQRSLIYAHARNGMFGALLQRGGVGELVDFLQSDGTVLHYKITEFYPRWSVKDTRWLKPDPHEEIVLVTCTTYNPNDPRVVAVATPV